MKRAILLFISTAASGCRDDDNRLAALEGATATLQSEVGNDIKPGMTVAQALAAEAAARQQATADALSAAKAYTDSRIAAIPAGPKGDTGASGIPGPKGEKGDPGPAASATKVAHLIGPNGEDLGVSRGNNEASLVVNGKTINVKYDYVPIVIYDGGNCTGNAFVATLYGTANKSTRIISPGGTLLRLTGPLQGVNTVSAMELKNGMPRCFSSSSSNVTLFPVTDTGVKAQSYAWTDMDEEFR